MSTLKPRKVNRHWGVLATLLFMFFALPWLLRWVAAYIDSTWTLPLFLPAWLWVTIPAAIFGKPLFRPLPHSFQPAGISGWLVAALFYVLIVVGVWAAIRATLWLRSAEDI